MTANNPKPSAGKAGADVRLYYPVIMEEIKLRVNLLTAIRTNQITELPEGALFELAYLQLRYICEMIGCACLCAHGDLPATKRPDIQALYKPGQIFAKLEELNPDFFPRAGKIIRDDKGSILGLQPALIQPLTKEDLKTLYDKECNEVLHWGSLKKPRFAQKRDFKRVDEWEQRIVELLNVHFIRLAVPKKHLWVRMSSIENDGKVAAQVVLVRSQEPSVPMGELARFLGRGQKD